MNGDAYSFLVIFIETGTQIIGHSQSTGLSVTNKS